MQCGVGQFTLRLAQTLETREGGSTAALTLSQTQGSPAEIWRAVGSARNIVCNFPIVAWKRVIVSPLLALLFARLRGRRAILVQHEWGSLHWLRRLTYLPAVLLANRIVMFSALVRKELASDPLVGWTARKCTLAPLPPNIEAPVRIADLKLRQRLAEARAQGRLVIGHFGSIYPAKQPNALLSICATLKARGERPLLVYIGSFIRAMDNVEEDFYARARELGVERRRHRHRLCRFRRTRCSACSASSMSSAIRSTRASPPGDPAFSPACSPASPLSSPGRPKPMSSTIIRASRQLIDRGAIVLVPRGADADAYADRIVAAAKRPASPDAI